MTPGARVGPYEVLAAVGAGGMGEVYLALDTRLDRRVALKVLPERFARDPESLARFAFEARSVAALSHPNILALHDVGEEAGIRFAVTEILEGATLRERLEDGPLPVRKAVDYAVQIANGLGAAHDRGIIHRDLKPENLFVTSDGRLKILDFGLAVQAATASSDPHSSPTVGRGTDPGVVVGTAGYMAPEQVRGEALDQRADLFALGCVLYELLCAQRAFQRETPVETMTAVLRDQPLPLAELQPSLPAGLVRIVDRCLEKSPAERFQSARDLAFHLEQWAALSGTGERPANLPRRLRFRPGIAAGVGLLVGAAAGIGLARWLTRTPLPAAATARYLTHAGEDFEPTSSPDGRSVAFMSRRDGSPRIWVKQLATGDEVALTEGPDRAPRFSPDGNSILFARTGEGGSALYAVGALGGTPRRLVPDAVEGDWSPDGRRLMFVRQGHGSAEQPTLVVTDVDGGEERVVARAQDARLWSPRWSPDGRRLAVLEGGVLFGTRGVLLLVGSNGEGIRRLSVADRGVPVAIGWSSNRELLVARTEAVTGAAGQLLVGNPDAGEWRMLFATPMPVATFDRLPSGRLVLGTVAVRQNVAELNLRDGRATGALRWLTRGSSVDRQPAFSPDGEWVAFSSDRSGNLDVWAVSARTLALRRLTHDPADDFDPVFAPGGQSLLWSSRRSGHFEVWAGESDGSQPRRLTSDGVDAQNPSLTTDGRFVVYGSVDPRKPGIFRIPSGGGPAGRLTAELALIPEVSPDGRYVACIVPQAGRRFLRVVDVEQRAPAGFEVVLETGGAGDLALGRARWMPGGRALAFIGLDERGRAGIYVQDFSPGHDTASTLRRLAGFEPDREAESFGFARDGSRMAISMRERQSALLLVEGLPASPAR